jgi:hypothetical protein
VAAAGIEERWSAGDTQPEHGQSERLPSAQPSSPGIHGAPSVNRPPISLPRGVATRGAGAMTTCHRGNPSSLRYPPPILSARRRLAQRGIRPAGRRPRPSTGDAGAQPNMTGREWERVGACTERLGSGFRGRRV